MNNDTRHVVTIEVHIPDNDGHRIDPGTLEAWPDYTLADSVTIVRELCEELNETYSFQFYPMAGREATDPA